MSMTNIHPTAVVDSSAKLADDVEVGPYAIIEGDVEIGPGTVVRPHAVIRRYTTLGAGNYVDSFVALGGEPQDYKFDAAQVSYLRIGDKNIFREGVTISRGTGDGSETRVGSGTYWMANSHAGHNCIIEDGVILANSALVAGHCTVGRKAILPANGSIHQFIWIGEMCMFQGGAQISMHAPPFCMLAEDNTIVGLNVVGLRRSPEITDADRKDVKEVFQLLYRSGLTPTKALEEMDKLDLGSAGTRFREFVRKAINAEAPYSRGIVPNVNRGHQRKQGLA
jgi:UDP-N-acetylglucosamine acyltransferase